VDEEQALVAAVRADPNDNTRRLAFADWLDEHGQHQRAAWVRDGEIFWWMGPDYVTPLPQILEQLRHEDPDERDKVGPVVERLRGEAVPMLREAFATGDEDLRGGLAEIFAWVRDGVPRPLPVLIADVRSSDWATALVAATELQWHGAITSEALPALVEAWERWTSEEYGYDYPSNAIVQIARALERLGPGAISAIPSLLTTPEVYDSIADTAYQIIRAMGPDAIPAVRRLLSDTNEWVRYHAAVALTKLGIRASEVSPVIRSLLTSHDRAIADSAREWLRAHRFPLTSL
jgi:uncharacterized protein (TIGR02996 family)